MCGQHIKMFYVSCTVNGSLHRHQQSELLYSSQTSYETGRSQTCCQTRCLSCWAGCWGRGEPKQGCPALLHSPAVTHYTRGISTIQTAAVLVLGLCWLTISTSWHWWHSPPARTVTPPHMLSLFPAVRSLHDWKTHTNTQWTPELMSESGTTVRHLSVVLWIWLRLLRPCTQGSGLVVTNHQWRLTDIV